MKAPLVVVAIVIAAVALGWAFFAHGGQSSAGIDDDRQEILAVQDERLSKGDSDASVAVIEYADVLCPYCAQANGELILPIESDYIDAGKVRYEVRLVAKIAPDSARAARGAYCAAEQDKFWDYLNHAYKTTWNDYYSQNKRAQDVPLFSKGRIGSFARQIDGLEVLPWQQCMSSDRYSDVLASNAEEMAGIDAYGTPHFVINGQSYNGAPPYAIFKATIDAEIGSSKGSA